MEAQPRPLTAEDAGGAEDAGKSVGRGCFFESKSSQAAKTFRISTAEEAEVAEVFWVVRMSDHFDVPERVLLYPQHLLPPANEREGGLASLSRVMTMRMNEGP